MAKRGEVRGEPMQGSPALMDDMMFSGGAKAVLKEGDDENARPYLGDLQTIDAILRTMGYKVLTPGDADPERHTRATLEQTAAMLLGRGNEYRVIEGWNTPDADGRVGLAEFLRQKFNLDPARPESIIAGVLAILTAEIFDLANSREKGEDVDSATDGLFQTYAWLFVGIDPASVE